MTRSDLDAHAATCPEAELAVLCRAALLLLYDLHPDRRGPACWAWIVWHVACERGLRHLWDAAHDAVRAERRQRGTANRRATGHLV